MDRVGNQKEVLIKCPECGRIYNVEKIFWDEPIYSDIQLNCPFCHKEFSKENSPKVWGL